MISFRKRAAAWKAPTACYDSSMSYDERPRSSDDLRAWPLTKTYRESLWFKAAIVVGLAVFLGGVVWSVLN